MVAGPATHTATWYTRRSHTTHTHPPRCYCHNNPMHVTAHTTLLSLILPFLPSLTRAALQHRPLTAQPQDPFATPKFEVSFLNQRPISVSDAKEWQGDNGSWSGLRGFEAMDEFVYGRRDTSTGARSISKKTIGDSGALFQQTRPNIVRLRLPSPSTASKPPLHDYLCLIPSPSMVQPTEADAIAHEEALRAAEEIPDPQVGWESLKHLDGKCLYSRQGWFSYSYCHDSHVRQFREAPHQHPHPPGGIIPVEDHEVSVELSPFPLLFW
jgi:protein OS-9